MNNEWKKKRVGALVKNVNRNPESGRYVCSEEDLRIVKRIYEVLGYGNGSSILEESLQEIADYVSQKEEKKYSVRDIGRAYKSVTQGRLNIELRIAIKMPISNILERAAKLRLQNSIRGYHMGEVYRTSQEEEFEMNALSLRVRDPFKH